MCKSDPSCNYPEGGCSGLCQQDWASYVTIPEIRRLKAETEKRILELLREFEKMSEGAVTMALVHRSQVIGKEHGEIVAVNLEVKVL
jgi:hypothetical protein